MQIYIILLKIFEADQGPGQPIARLTPLGWTCVGALSDVYLSDPKTHFACIRSSYNGGCQCCVMTILGD